MATRRRDWLRNLAGLGVCGSLAEWESLARLGTASAADARVTPDLVRLEPDVEPLVRKLEETPREKCFEMITAELRGGLPYRRLLAALFLAGVRNVNPRPPGFDLHCVFVIHAAHQMALDAAPSERLLPLYWAVDEFKNAQQKDAAKATDFRMAPLGGSLPSAGNDEQELHAALEAWDGPRAERAVVALARRCSAGEVIELLWRYGARDFRNIGHKTIYVANAWRTLETIGWRHAEPVLRSLVTSLVDFGADQKVNEYAYSDQCYPANLRRVETSFAKLPGDWSSGAADDGATRDLLAVLREAERDAACESVLDGLRQGQANSAAAWDAVHLAAGELMMQQPGIVGLHVVTSVNALRYAFQATTLPETRLLLLLQAVGWVKQFQRASAARMPKQQDVRITTLAEVDLPTKTDDALAEVFRRKPAEAAPLALAYGKQGLDPAAFTAAARSLVFTKATDPHGYKYPVAVFEDYHWVSPAWRPHMLAVGTYYLPRSTTPDSPLMQKAREEVRSLTS